MELNAVSPSSCRDPSLEPETVREWIRNTPGLELYEHYLENILRKKAHTLPAEQEQLLAAAGEMAQAPRNIFTMFNNADLKFPEVKNDAGEMVELTHGRYIQFLESPNREVRKGAFDALYKTYTAWKNTLGATYNSALKRSSISPEHASTIRLWKLLCMRKCGSRVYRNLINSVHDHLAPHVPLCAFAQEAPRPG